MRWKPGRRRAGKDAGCVMQTLQGRSYRAVKFGGKLHYAHRIAWRLMTGLWPTHTIDHINGDGLDNRWSNMREATVSENGWNRKIDARSRTGVPGVSFNSRSGKFKVDIQANGRRQFFGSFETLEEAAGVANAHRRRLHGKFARLPNQGD